MRILIVSDTATHPTNAGNSKLILEYCNLFNRWGHGVHIVYIPSHGFTQKGQNAGSVEREAMKTYWGNRYHEYKRSFWENIKNNYHFKYRKVFSNGYCKCDDVYPNGLTSYVNSLNEKYHFDACIVNYIRMSKALEGINIPRKALFTHDYYTYKNLLVGEMVDYACKPNEEAKALQRAPYIFAMQDIEAAFFHCLSPNSKILINYANYTYHEQAYAGNHNLMFLSGNNQFNIKGIKWFIADILPLIYRSYPDTKLIIGGKICSCLNEYKDDSHIDLQGLIDDANAFFLQGDVAINPTFLGTGLKIKTFESMAFDKVVIVHPHSSIGIYKKDSAPLFSSDNPSEWLDFICRIWDDRNKVEEIKVQNKNYISEMNDFIEGQYKEFLNN